MRRRPAVRVLLVALDGFPVRAISPEQTPRLWRLGVEGGRAPEGGRSPLPSTTYPGCASLLTGAGLDTHHVRTTASKAGAVPGWAGDADVAVPTILDACRDASLGAAAVMSDHHLYRVLRIGAPDDPWPTGGRLPARAPRDAHGYPTNEYVWPAMARAICDPTNAFIFCQLSEADTVGHDHGPDSHEATSVYGETDRVVGRLLASLEDSWADWVVIVVSDHDMEACAEIRGTDPMAVPGVAAIASDWIGDGGSAWLQLRPGVRAEMVDEVLRQVPGASGWRWFGERVLLLGEPGQAWNGGSAARVGLHGGPSTRRTVALVGGGHPSVLRLARTIRHHPPELRDWAPTIGALLGISLPDADGQDLLAGSTIFG